MPQIGETITRSDPLPMVDIFWWVLSIAFVDSLTMDYSLECEAGYRISSIHRLTSLYEKSGALMIFCDLIEANASKVNCERLESVPQCSGAPEGCTGGSWLAGFHAYVIENSTEATLLDPVCCRSANIRVDERSCIHDRLNKVGQSFQHGIASDLLYRGLQCWHQYNADNTLVDLIWKMEICAFTSTLGSPLLTTRCRHGCDCFCGIEQCADGRYPIKIIHRQQQKQNSCECHCNCAYKCL
uniref:Thyroglobulin type-1 domain-containing protein n=1 Tax=Ascaris lumbricoides TaxID=6252 RepID=A0A9J2Q5E9_ASCLU